MAEPATQPPHNARRFLSMDLVAQTVLVLILLTTLAPMLTEQGDGMIGFALLFMLAVCGLYSWLLISSLTLWLRYGWPVQGRLLCLGASVLAGLLALGSEQLGYHLSPFMRTLLAAVGGAVPLAYYSLTVRNLRALYRPPSHPYDFSAKPEDRR